VLLGAPKHQAGGDAAAGKSFAGKDFRDAAGRLASVLLGAGRKLCGVIGAR
jgi:hypothetical protein